MIKDIFKDIISDIKTKANPTSLLNMGVDHFSANNPLLSYLITTIRKNRTSTNPPPTPPPAPPIPPAEDRIDDQEDEANQEKLVSEAEEQSESLDNIDETTKSVDERLKTLNESLLLLIKTVEEIKQAGLNGGQADPGLDVDVGGGRGGAGRGVGRFGRIGSAITEIASSQAVKMAAVAAAAGAAGYEGANLMDQTDIGHEYVTKPIRNLAADIASFLGFDEYADAQRGSLAARDQEKTDVTNKEYESKFIEDLKTQKMTRQKAEYYMQANPGLIIPEENIISNKESIDSNNSYISPAEAVVDDSGKINYDLGPTDEETNRLKQLQFEKASTDETKKLDDREEEKIDLFKQMRDALLLMLSGVGNAMVGTAEASESGEGESAGEGFERSVNNNTSSAGEIPIEGNDVSIGNNKSLTKHKSNASNFVEWVGEADAGKLGPAGLSVVYGQKHHGKDLTKMTVGQVREQQRTWKADNISRGLGSSAAAGSYQLMDYTIDDLVEKGVISKDDKFDAATQQKAGKWLATQKAGRKPVRDWLKAKKAYQAGKMSEKEYEVYRREAAVSLSGEWAALPDPNRGGRSHYAGDGINGATRNLEQTYEAMDKLPFSWEESRASVPQTNEAANIEQATAEANVEKQATDFMNQQNNGANSSPVQPISNNNNVGQSSPTQSSLQLSSNEQSPLSTRNSDNTITRLTDKYFSYGVT